MGLAGKLKSIFGIQPSGEQLEKMEKEKLEKEKLEKEKLGDKKLEKKDKPESEGLPEIDLDENEKYTEEECALCGNPYSEKKWAGQYWHKKCMRKARKGAMSMAKGMG